jgi:HEPN domain-containing protein
MRPRAFDELCFHCQQAAEKFLKALQQEWGIKIPKIHDLDGLLDLLLHHDASLVVVRPGLVRLSRYAVDYRYPAFHADARQAKVSLKLAERVRLETRKRLGLQTKP